MMELHISQVGLSAPDLERFKETMVTIVSNKSMSVRWCMGDPDTAHLVLVSPDSPEAQSFVAARAAGERQIIAAVVGESDVVTFDCVKLPWPIKSASLLELLGKVERRIRKSDSALPSGILPASEANKLVQLAMLIRDAPSGDKLAWRISGLAERSIYVVPGQGTFISGDSLLHLLQLDMNLVPKFVPFPHENLPPLGEQKPIRMLQWLIGLRIGHMGLLPWIKADSTFSLKQLPEFQLLHHSPEHRRIAAALSRPRAGIKVVSEVTELRVGTVVAFINAASLCGYLKISDGGGAAAPASNGMSGGSRRTLFQVLRKALGIASADAART
jgi:hypothetical protein